MGLIAMLLLAAIDSEPVAIVDDYLETVRLADLRAATSNRNNAESEIEALCQTSGTTTKGAFRTALLGPDLATLLTSPGLSEPTGLQSRAGAAAYSPCKRYDALSVPS